MPKGKVKMKEAKQTKKETKEETKELTQEEIEALKVKREMEKKAFVETDNETGCMALGMAIVESAVMDFVMAWEKGNYELLRDCENFLNSEKVELFTLGQFDGNAIYNKLVKRCNHKYGQFVRQ